MVTLFVLLALAMTATFMVGMQVAFSIGWRDAVRPIAMDYVDKLATELGTPPSVERAQILVQRLPLRVDISGPVVNWRSHPDQADVPQRPDNRNPWGKEERFWERTSADGHRIRFGLSTAVWNDKPRYIGWITLSVLLLLTALAYLRVRRLLRPLDAIREGALRFGSGDFNHPIKVPQPHHPDELGELAASINAMAADIEQMLEAKRSLLLAISHELRSPLTRARLNTELLPETDDVQIQRLALLRDLALMRDLVSDLLESERLSNRHVALHREATDLGELVAEVARSMSQAVNTAVTAELPALQLDPVRIRLLVRNLLDNALRHSAGASQIPLLQVSETPDGVQLSVRDFGAGVPPEQLPQLAQAFYRPDVARSRDDGGVGLGLYLCKLVALAHGGRFEIANAHPGLNITVTLPKN
jgi:signal transduction histidine kinase